MDITLNGKEVIFKWIPIEGASAYEFSLRDKTNSIFKVTAVKDTVISLNIAVLENEKPYNWLISGTTKEGRYFEYTGDIYLADNLHTYNVFFR